MPHTNVIKYIKCSIGQRIRGALSLPGASPTSVHTLWGVNNVLCSIMGEDLVLSPNIHI